MGKPELYETFQVDFMDIARKKLLDGEEIQDSPERYDVIRDEQGLRDRATRTEMFCGDRIPGVDPDLVDRYQAQSPEDCKNAVREIALLGLWRTPFCDHAAFYGGSALRIFHGLQRFSADLDFSLLAPGPNISAQGASRCGGG